MNKSLQDCRFGPPHTLPGGGYWCMGVRTNPKEPTQLMHSVPFHTTSLELWRTTHMCMYVGRDVDTDEWYYVMLPLSPKWYAHHFWVPRLPPLDFMKPRSVLHNFAMLYPQLALSDFRCSDTLARMRVCAYGPTATATVGA